MSKRNGGSNTERKTTNDVYFSQDSADWLIDWLIDNHLISIKSCLHANVLDACCGKGALGLALKTYIPNIDFLDHKFTMNHIDIILRDILSWSPLYKYDIILCNPPWSPVSRALDIYMHLLSLLKPNGTLYFIINYAFINTNWQRGASLGNGYRIDLPRYTFAKSQKENNPDSNGLLDPVLIIKGDLKLTSPPPFFCPIPPEICKTDQKLMAFV